MKSFVFTLDKQFLCGANRNKNEKVELHFAPALQQATIFDLDGACEFNELLKINSIFNLQCYEVKQDEIGKKKGILTTFENK